MVCENINVNGNHLTFAQRDVTELAEKYGTPLYLMDEDRIRNNCRVYKKAMAENTQGGIVYDSAFGVNSVPTDDYTAETPVG